MTTDFETQETALIKAVRKMLKPLVRLLIQQNITFVGLQNLLKRTYIEVAEKSFCLKNKKLTDSRISLLTGIHRADVKRIRNEDTDQITEKEIKAGLSAQIIAKWTGDPDYLDSNQLPKPLLKSRSTEKNIANFEDLVLSVSKDKHPRSLMDEWLNQGIIEMKNEQNQEWIFLTEKGYVPEADLEEKLFFAGKNIGEHLEVIANNLSNNAQPLFDRAVYYDHLTQQSLDELEALAKEKLLQVLMEINQKANALQTAEKSKPEALHAFHLGAYFNKHQDPNHENI
ncbi:hypothetical protein CYQ88_04230 [Hydrogenovibrio sp. SC-1]|uniref:DUF6502 family protein n=1 Tax=Hydrogenovibrio sp. SC-1 TaxID=2065820 RepID=UPI000C7D84A1|nr:DUF6502 family protein [Hydrogenovibrio sp. SC-1]PLA74804.1 hypothetical protein CYQ88_04230 [Hydrogenovibrio sp. SC-1]